MQTVLKRICFSVILLFASFAWAEDGSPARTNLILKGIFGTRTSISSTAGGREAVVMRALKGLIKAQNTDGSWGEKDSMQLSTALALCAILRHGYWHYRDVRGFDSVVKPAHQWLLESMPKTDAERVATAIALSDHITFHYNWHYRKGGENKNNPTIPPEQVGKLRECLGAISPQCGELWKDWLYISRLPEQIDRRPALKTYLVTLAKYQDNEFDALPSSLDHYLLIYLSTLARFNKGGKMWEAWNKQFKPSMAKLQESDGLFPCTPVNDRIAATGLSVMSLTIFYMCSERFVPDMTR